MPDLKLRSNMMPVIHTPISGEPDINSPCHHFLLIFITNESIVSLNPFSVSVLQVVIQTGRFRLLHNPD